MESQPHRKPLQPKNSHTDPSDRSHPKPKPIKIGRLLSIEGNADKENRQRPAEIGRLEASLAEELGAVRRRRERLRSDRERTERMLKERDRVMERGLKEMERRGEEQRKVEMELKRIIWIMDLRSCVRFTPVQSLRAKEQEKSSRERQLKELNCAEGNEAEWSTQ